MDGSYKEAFDELVNLEFAGEGGEVSVQSISICEEQVTDVGYRVL